MKPAERLDINRVLEHYDVRTYHRYKYMTNCPLHEDAHPSFSVNTEKNLWKCQSCGEGGDGYTLIMKKEDCDFRGAVELAATLGLATGGPGGGDDDVRGSHFAGRRMAPRKGDRPSRGRYVPSWRRH